MRNEGSHGLRFGTFAGNGIAGATIIDFVRFDEAQRHKSGHAQNGGGKEHRILCEIAADKTLGNGRNYDTGGGEAVISPGPGRHGTLAYEAETDCCDCKRDNCCRKAVEDLRNQDQRELRGRCKD